MHFWWLIFDQIPFSYCVIFLVWTSRNMGWLWSVFGVFSGKGGTDSQGIIIWRRRGGGRPVNLLPRSTFWLPVNQSWTESPILVPLQPLFYCSLSCLLAKGGSTTQFIQPLSANALENQWMFLDKHISQRITGQVTDNTFSVGMSWYCKSFILD